MNNTAENPVNVIGDAFRPSLLYRWRWCLSRLHFSHKMIAVAIATTRQGGVPAQLLMPQPSWQGQIRQTCTFKWNIETHPMDSKHHIRHTIILFLCRFGRFSRSKVKSCQEWILSVNWPGSCPSLTFLSNGALQGFHIAGLAWPDLLNLFTLKMSFPPLTEMKAGFQTRGSLLLSVISRINTVRMNVLPKFLFLFQSLSVFFTFWLNCWFKFFWGKIWNHKKKKHLGLSLRALHLSGALTS